MTRGAGRGLIGAAVLLAALLVLVALASRGHLGAESAEPVRTRPGLPAGAFAYAYAIFLVAGLLVLPLFFYVYARETPYSARRRRRARMMPFVLVALAGLGLLAATRWGAELGDVIASLQFWRDGGGDADAAAAAAAARPPAPGWAPLAVAASLALAGFGGFLTWRTLTRRGLLGRRESLAEALSDLLDETLDDLRAEPDSRRAIILAYSRMEAALERSGVARQEAEAPLEYLSRILLALDVSPPPVRALTDLFERAKFSNHPIEPDLKEEAIAALERVRTELRELA